MKTETKNEIKKNMEKCAATILASLDLEKVGRRIALMVDNDASWDRRSASYLKKRTVQHVMSLIARAMIKMDLEILQNVYDDEKAMRLDVIAMYGHPMSISLGWKLSSNVFVSYMINTDEQKEWDKEAKLLLERVGYEMSNEQ